MKKGRDVKEIQLTRREELAIDSKLFCLDTLVKEPAPLDPPETPPSPLIRKKGISDFVNEKNRHIPLLSYVLAKTLFHSFIQQDMSALL